MARWALSFAARNPTDLDGEWQIGVHGDKIQILRNRGHEQVLARYLLVEPVAQDPTMIIRGWHRQDTNDSCFVYVGRPSRDYRGRNIEVPAPKGMLFLVFVLPDGTIDLWGWRPVDGNDPDMPSGMTGDVIWHV